MKKIDSISSLRVLLSLVSIMMCMSINAQIIEVYKNDGAEPVATYTFTSTDQYKIVFDEGVDSTPFDGKFTVKAAESENPAKQVRFTKGNLQATYNGSSYTWSIAKNQWDYIGAAAGNTTINSQSIGAVVDLFGWSTTTKTNYGLIETHDENDYHAAFRDWGGLFPDKNYSTLSTEEWQYLLSTRTVNGGTGEGKSYKRTTLTLSDGTKTVYGLLIAPDDYTGTLSDKTSWSDWQAMEYVGVVFLPAAGRRSDPEVWNPGAVGRYWSSSRWVDENWPYHVFGYNLSFSDGGIKPQNFTEVSYDIYLGYSVRLVSVVSE